MRKNNIISESLYDLKRFKKLINESFDDGSMQQAQQPMQGQEMGGNMEQPMGDDMEQPMEGDGQMSDIIDQIRQLAIQGIAQYADQVESEMYKSLKRIWLETDKFYECLIGDDNKKK